MATLSDLVGEVIMTLDKINVSGLQNMAYLVKCYQNLDIVRDGVKKLEKELEELHDQGNNIEE